jgi:hypothetical protein
MGLFDLGPSILRSVIALWPCVLVLVITVILALVFRMRKLAAIVFIVITVVPTLFKRSPEIVTQWRLGMLESKSPIANEAAFKKLSQDLNWLEVQRLLLNQREDPNVRFAMALMLHERRQYRFLPLLRVIQPLQRPAYLGDGHLAEAAKRYEYPLDPSKMSVPNAIAVP